MPFVQYYVFMGFLSFFSERNKKEVSNVQLFFSFLLCANQAQFLDPVFEPDMPGTLGESIDHAIGGDKNKYEQEHRKVKGPSVEKNVKAFVKGRVGVVHGKGRNIHCHPKGAIGTGRF